MSATPAPSAPAIPGYDLLEAIGEGGMGVVYKAQQHQPLRTVAVKLLAPLPANHFSIEAFQREARLMATLDHANVVRLYDWGQSEGRYYLVMEYVSGPTLRSRMTPYQPWTVEYAVPVLEAIAQALGYIHEMGILHLDLKPENVLLSAFSDPSSDLGQTESEPFSSPTADSRQPIAVKITDFGLALRRVDARTLSELGLAQGTIDYCSPEQRYGLPIDPRSDLFSLAILAYELLTGFLPGRVFVSACQRNPRLPAAVDGVLRRGLARDPDERYGTVADFCRDLIAALEVGTRLSAATKGRVDS